MFHGLAVYVKPTFEQGKGIFMNRASTPICVAAALGMMLGGASLAGAQEQFTDQDLQTFASAVIQIERINMEVQQQVQAAETPEEQQQVQAQAQAQMVQVIEAEGLTVDEYNEIATAVQTDPQLAEQIQQHLMDMQ
jgi:hypothetical protein